MSHKVAMNSETFLVAWFGVPCESGWGSKATVMVGPGRNGRLWKTTAENPECVELTPPQPEPHMANGIAHFIWALTTGSQFHPLCRAATCRNTQEVLEAAITASETHQEVALPLKTGG